MVEDLSTWSVPELVQPERRGRGVPGPPKVPAGAAEKVYDYAPGVAVEVPVALGQPLDIVLEAGEHGAANRGRGPGPSRAGPGPPVGSERRRGRRWGRGSGRMCLSPWPRPGLTNGVTITTTRRTYYISCKSVAKSPVRVLRWHYPPESAAPARARAGDPRAAAAPGPAAAAITWATRSKAARQPGPGLDAAPGRRRRQKNVSPLPRGHAV